MQAAPCPRLASIDAASRRYPSRRNTANLARRSPRSCAAFAIRSVEDHRHRRPLVDMQPEHIRSRVMAGDVEVIFAARNLAHVEIGDEDLALVEHGAREHLPERPPHPTP